MLGKIGLVIAKADDLGPNFFEHEVATVQVSVAEQCFCYQRVMSKTGQTTPFRINRSFFLEFLDCPVARHDRRDAAKRARLFDKVKMSWVQQVKRTKDENASFFHILNIAEIANLTICLPSPTMQVFFSVSVSKLEKGGLMSTLRDVAKLVEKFESDCATYGTTDTVRKDFQKKVLNVLAVAARHNRIPVRQHGSLAPTTEIGPAADALYLELQHWADFQIGSW